jgi:flagellar FliL protein
MAPVAGERAMAEKDDGDETEAAADGEAEGAEEGGEIPRPKSGRTKLLIILAAAVVVLLLGAGAGLYFSGLLDSLLGKKQETVSPDDLPPGKVFYKLENITLNMNAEGRTARFLQIGLTIVLVKQEDVAKVEAVAPRIIDYVSNYMRELAPEELEGSASFYRLREGLLLRVRAAVAPVPVTDVLFNSVLTQ